MTTSTQAITLILFLALVQASADGETNAALPSEQVSVSMPGDEPDAARDSDGDASRPPIVMSLPLGGEIVGSLSLTASLVKRPITVDILPILAIEELPSERDG